jgi:hypothetical protein
MICINEQEIGYYRDTLALLLAVHSLDPDPSLRAAALEILAKDGATDTASAQTVLLGRILEMSEKFL